MNNVIDVLRDQYNAVINQEEDWGFFSALAGYINYILGITKDMFADKLKEFKEEQAEIRFKLTQHDKADEKYYITANAVLNMIRFALDIFKSSEPNEQRQELNFLFQNFQINGKKLDYTLREPFYSVAKYATCPTLLRR